MRERSGAESPPTARVAPTDTGGERHQRVIVGGSEPVVVSGLTTAVLIPRASRCYRSCDREHTGTASATSAATATARRRRVRASARDGRLWADRMQFRRSLYTVPRMIPIARGGRLTRVLSQRAPPIS